MDESSKAIGNPLFFRKPDGGYSRPIFKRADLEKLAKKVPAGDGGPYGLALLILVTVFGLEWVERNILSEPKSGFLGRHLGTDDGATIVMHRVRDLAELVVNLLPVRGVEAPLDQLIGDKIESAYAELEVGRLLLTRGIDFRFIWPSGVRGESFDLEVLFPNGRRVCADTKCKVETDAFSDTGVFNALTDARKCNLPKGYPGMVIIKIPQAWHKSEAIREKVQAQCENFLRGTKRIVCIQIYSSMVELRSGTLHYWDIGTEVRNNRHDYNPSLDWRLLTNNNGPVAVDRSGWWRLVDFF